MFLLHNLTIIFDTFFFRSNSSNLSLYVKILGTASIISLYVVGILHWILFFSGGDMSFEKMDWVDGQFYYAAARDMVVDLKIPYFTNHSGPAWGDSRFLANPQTFMSPQILLFPLFTIGQAVILNTLILYSVGFFGLYLIKKHFRLSIIPFTIIFLLFNFNGHITAHLGVGHTAWNGYFLLPFFFLVVLSMLQKQSCPPIHVPLLIALILLCMMMQGSFHFFNWCIMFLFCIGFVHHKYLKTMAFSIFFACLFSLFRLVPTALVRLDYKASYASGYPTINTLVDALTTIKAHLYQHPRSAIYDVGWHEHDIFIGFIGLAFIIFFGFYHRYSKIFELENFKFPTLDLPIFIFILLSFGFVFDVISDLQMPLLSWAERVPSRFLIIPLILLTILSAIRMEALLPKIQNNVTFKLATLLGVGLLTHTLFAHSWYWRLDSWIPGPHGVAPRITFDFPQPYDERYVLIVSISWLISILSILIITSMVIWTRKNPSNKLVIST